MQVISVNVGQRRIQANGKELESTGIYKISTPDVVEVATLGLRGDIICDQKNHGGPDQAIYIYGTTDYAWWIQNLDRELEPGTFGENLTIAGLESSKFSVGDRMLVGDIVLEVSAPRFPCSTLAARMGDSGFVKKYRRAERPGMYCRVVVGGNLKAGQEVTIEPSSEESITVLDLFREHYKRSKSEQVLRRALRAPISIRARRGVIRDLQKLLESNPTI